MVYHAAGWLEGGLIASPEKFIMDCEILQQLQRYMDPAITATTPDDIALDAIREVGDQGHFFGIQHTQDRYTTAFYQPFLSDWRNFEAWQEAGSIWTAERAHLLYKSILAEFEAPEMDPAMLEIFLEEFDSVRRQLQGNLSAWIDDVQDAGSLAELRRGFHTLKGSGRMVGAERIGEYCWAVENLLNRLINRTLQCTPPMVDFITEAAAAVPAELIDACHLVGPAERIKERLGRWKEASSKGHVAAMMLGCQQPEALELIAGEML